MSKIFVTGGSGKAGKHLIPYLLEKGYSVVNADLVPLLMDGVDNINLDVTDSGQLFNALSGYANIPELKSGEGPESYKAVGLRAKKPEELDDVSNEMINTDKTVIADIWVSKEENCFPMIQSGSAHNEMVLSKDQKQDESSAEKGKILV